MGEPTRVRIERGAKRVRAMLGGRWVADTRRPLLVWEVPYYPTYYFPNEDVALDVLTPTGEERRSPSRGRATEYHVKVNGSEGRAYAYLDPKIPELEGHVAFVWDTMDHWFEEDEEVYVHARDPYTRVDIVRSDREIKVEIDGVTVAESTNGSFLFETGLPTRYYLPKADVRMDLMVPTETVSKCPYKGVARYWSARIGDAVHRDVLWGYDHPVPESQKIAGMVSFYNEKVDVYVDGELQERPKTKFS
jgi:uncharacterized protein (DUF427 family)